MADNSRGRIMQVSLVLSFVGILVLVVASVQNNVPVEISLFAWTYQTTLTKVIALTGLIGAAVVVVILIPRMIRKQLVIRRLKKELAQEKQRSVLTRPAAGRQSSGARS